MGPDGGNMATRGERPADWIQDHMTRYLETNGEDGHMFSGTPSLLLTTKGRTTGDLYTTPLIYGQDGDSYVLVASRGGAPKHPGDSGGGGAPRLGEF